mmetsp:Transcript_23648/g.80636  ORF Transcript_23648/g.80636 Transcript_23648/m.80636 type:complete len:232 (-) Transcript_23648:1819-2514(-)
MALGAQRASPQSRRAIHRGARAPLHRRAVVAAAAAQTTGVVDEAKALASSSFPIKPEQLIVKAKEVLAANFGCDKPELLADEFFIVLPVVKLPKDDFVNIFGSFDIKSAMPDLDERFFGFTVDPTEPNRVWFFGRGIGTHTEKFLRFEATGKTIDMTPQVSSLIFNEDGLVTKLTTGYPVDREAGNCGGLGGAFGIFHGIAPNFLPFPEGRPYERSWQMKLALAFGNLFRS